MQTRIKRYWGSSPSCSYATHPQFLVPCHGYVVHGIRHKNTIGYLFFVKVFETFLLKLLTFADTGIFLLPSCFHDPDDFCEPLKANGARSIVDDYVQNNCEALKFNNTLSNLDLSRKSISYVAA